MPIPKYKMAKRAKINAWIKPIARSNGFQMSWPTSEPYQGSKEAMTTTISPPEKMLPKSRNVSVMGFVSS